VLQRLNQDNSINLWRFDPKDNGLKQLTKEKDDEFPDCSPDSKSVIYQQAKEGKQVLALVSIDGTGQRTFDARSNDSLRYSPDGTKIAVLTIEGEGAQRQVKVLILEASQWGVAPEA